MFCKIRFILDSGLVGGFGETNQNVSNYHFKISPKLPKKVVAF